MKITKLSLVFILCLCTYFANAQQTKIRPEFTVRAKAQFFTGGFELTGGACFNNKWTVGALTGYNFTYIDAAPAEIFSIITSAYARRCFHLGGEKDIVALYVDVSLGAGWVYKVNGKYSAVYDVTTGEMIMGEAIRTSPGDVNFLAALEPGIRFRIYRNLHIFLGPTLSTQSYGLHIGIGF